ncbi:MAG: GNAT family N-acetyltransferase [Armatimonadetes bacterium]|nr:GNAT family N-acetyltransferase [Armatimonadota bacterium]
MPVPSGYRIRPFEPGDLPALQAITVETFAPVAIDRAIDDAFPGALPGSWADRKAAAIADDCRTEPAGVLVVVDADGAIAGYVTSRTNPTTRIGWIANLAVGQGHRRLGLGRALLEACKERLLAHGMVIAKIETLEHNEIGRALYPSLGFREIARQVHYIARLTDDAPQDGEGNDPC